MFGELNAEAMIRRFMQTGDKALHNKTSLEVYSLYFGNNRRLKIFTVIGHKKRKKEATKIGEYFGENGKRTSKTPLFNTAKIRAILLFYQMETKKTHRAGESAAPHFFIVAGETSGDMHAARLMKALKEREPLCQFSGIGGKEMAKEGLQSLAPPEITNVVGVWEVARRYGRLRTLLGVCAELLESGAFDAFIPVDYPGFNLRLAETAQKRGIPVIWYIAPQLWAWGEKRSERVRALVDMLLVILPFEEEYFLHKGIQARYVGHPLLERIPSLYAPLSERARSIALFPGSREQEIERNLPIMLRSVELLCARRSEARDYTPIIAHAPTIPKELYERRIQRRSGANSAPSSLETQGAKLFSHARGAMVKIGTSTLEAALTGTPHLAMYQASPLTYIWAKQRLRLSNVALPNILANFAGEDLITQEYLQSEATPENLALEMERLLFDNDYAETMQKRCARLRELLENPAPRGGAATNAARSVWEYIR